MTTVEIHSTPDGLLVCAPRLRRFVALAAALGAQPRGDNWLFAREHENQVRDFCRNALTSVPIAKMSALPGPPKREPEPADAEKRAAAFDASLVTLFDSSQPMSAHFRSAAKLALALDQTSPAEQLEEASAAFESFAARLRDWARRGVT